jgi:hypothetical protein
MRDPYEVLGIARGASFEEVRAAYRRACKTHHPDMGGSHEAMVELNTAYAFILNELKQGAQQRQETPKQEQASGQRDQARREETASAGARAEEPKERTERDWRKFYRDIDEELEELRRASQDYEERQRAMRKQAWESGQRFTWAKLTWDDLARFVGNLARGGVKGLATLFAALIGVGTILVEANLISALIILGSGIGFFLSLALKNDKGGFMSAGLLMFGRAEVIRDELPHLAATIARSPVRLASRHHFRSDLPCVDFQICSRRRYRRFDDWRRARAIFDQRYSRQSGTSAAGCLSAASARNSADATEATTRADPATAH